VTSEPQSTLGRLETKFLPPGGKKGIRRLSNDKGSGFPPGGRRKTNRQSTHPKKGKKKQHEPKACKKRSADHCLSGKKWGLRARDFFLISGKFKDGGGLRGTTKGSKSYLLKEGTAREK